MRYMLLIYGHEKGGANLSEAERQHSMGEFEKLRQEIAGQYVAGSQLHPTSATTKPMFEVLTTVTFDEQGGKTKQILRARVIKSSAQAAPYLAGMEAGWTRSLERLAAYVAKHAKE
jgi:hypothetical protein